MFLVIGLSPTGSTFSTQTNGVSPDPTTLFSSSPSGRPSSVSAMTPPSPTIATSSSTAMKPKQSTDSRRPYDPNTNYSTRYPSDQHYGSTESYHSTDQNDRYPQNKYPTRYGSSAPTLPNYNGYVHPNGPDPVSTTDQLHFYQELRPTYSYPMLYEKNYPLPNDKFIGYHTYAQNVPTIASDLYRPSSSGSTVPTSSYGLSMPTLNTNTANSGGYPNHYGSSGSTDDHNYRPSTSADNIYDRDRPTRYNSTGSIGYQPPTLATHFIDRPTGGYSNSNGE